MAEEDKTQQCPNCMKPISASNYTIHKLHCQRNFSVCKKCNDVFPVNQLQDHLETAHKNVNCGLCHLQLENYKIDDHQNNCPKRLIQCVYCELEVPCDELNDHENYCGSRTELCSVCNQYVMLRDQVVHEASGHLPIDKKTNTNNNRFSPLWNDFTTSQSVSIPFASKKANVETDLHTRQSPSKRNNDMPQVNTSFPHGWKEPEKPNINELETDSGSPSNNLDRMLALQMQEMDESNASDLNDFIKQAQMFSENIMNPSTLLQDPFDLNPDLVWSHQPLDDIFQSDPDFLRDHLTQSDHETTETEDGLPCEFCGLLYPADLLILHESGCCPDIAHGLKPDDFVEMRQQVTEKLLEPIDKIEANDVNVAMLPCSHCYEDFPSEILDQHERNCLAGIEFLRDLNSSSSPPPLTPRRYSEESVQLIKPKIHKCPSLNSPTKSVNVESKPPADHKFSDLTRTRMDPLYSVNRTGRNVNEYQPNQYPRRSSDSVQVQRGVHNVANLNPTNLSRRLSHLDKGHGENKNVNTTKTKPSATNLYLQEMKYNLKRPQERPNLVVTGAKPKSMSESSRPTPVNHSISGQGMRNWVPVREQAAENNPSGNHVPSYCRSNDGQLEATYRRFLAQQRAQYGTNSQQRSNNSQPKLKPTGAVPKTSRKSSSEE